MDSDSDDGWLFDDLLSRPKASLDSAVELPVVGGQAGAVADVEEETPEQWLRELTTPPPHHLPATLVALHAAVRPASLARRAAHPYAKPPPPPRQAKPPPPPHMNSFARRVAEVRRQVEAAELSSAAASSDQSMPSAQSTLSGSARLDKFLREVVLATGPLSDRDVPDQDSILMSLPMLPPILAPEQHCLRRLAEWLVILRPAIFKIGISGDPRDRWFNRDFGYGSAMDGIWHFMDVVYRGPAYECRALEMALISATTGLPGIYNVARGGEGVAPHRDHECFVYIVIACAGDGIPLKRSVFRRREELQFSRQP